jgi:GAF domain-containing protein
VNIPPRDHDIGPYRPYPSSEGPAVPFLKIDDSTNDLEAIRTWREALSDTFAQQGIPHDLFALWIYPPSGEAVLIGPDELSQDHLVLPRAEPFIDPAQLGVLEEILRDARYGSAVAAAIRHGNADVGLVLLGALEIDRYPATARIALDRMLMTVAPMVGRVARRWPVGHTVEEGAEGIVASRAAEAATSEAHRMADMLSSLGQASSGAGTPRDFVLALSFAMQPLLPHDAIDILIPDTTPEQTYRLSGHGHGPLWSDPQLVLPRAACDVERLFTEAGIVRVRNTDTDARGPFPLPLGEPNSAPARSLIGVRLRILERTVGFLLVSTPGPDFYQAEDVILLDHIGALIAARIDSFVLSWQHQVLKSHLAVLRHVPMHLSQIAELLASTPLLGEGTRQFARLAGQLLPLGHIEFAVRLSDDHRVAIVKPGDITALPDRPQTPLAATPAARVIRGEIPYLLTETPSPNGPVSALVVPLRTGGHVFGALAMTSTAAEPLTRTDMAVAQQLADLIAPHFEILRRSAAAPAPFIPGWKRTPKL